MKAKQINGKIRQGLPKYYDRWAGGFADQSDKVHEEHGFYPVIDVECNYITQTKSSIFWDEVNKVFTYTVTDKSQEQIDAEEEAYLDSLDNNVDMKVVKTLLSKTTDTILEDESTLTQDDIDIAKAMYKQWRKNTSYAIDTKVVYDDILYKVVQAHTSQSDWTPPTVPALFTKFTPAGQVSEWVQPTGAHDSYELGDEVTHNGNTWESTHDGANSWEPGVYGWTII